MNEYSTTLLAGGFAKVFVSLINNETSLNLWLESLKGENGFADLD